MEDQLTSEEERNNYYETYLFDNYYERKLEKTMIKLIFKKAKVFSIRKWEIKVEHGGDLPAMKLDALAPELKYLRAQCGFCELYRENKQCPNCPLNLDGVDCNNPSHPWYKWSMNRTEANAQILLDMCINAKEKSHVQSTS